MPDRCIPGVLLESASYINQLSNWMFLVINCMLNFDIMYLILNLVINFKE